jgi:hypothetical protein
MYNLNICAFRKPCRDGKERPQVPDGGEGFLIQRVEAVADIR